MRSEPDDEIRVVVDESTLDFRGLAASEIEDGLDLLNETIGGLRDKGILTATSPMWDATEVLDGCELIDYLSRGWPSDVDRDTLILASSLLGNCPEWSDDAGDVAPESSIAGAEPALALSVGYALSRYLQRHAVACLTFPSVLRVGLLEVTSGGRRGEAFFLADLDGLKDFWRWRMRWESVAEVDFFAACDIAFPALKMHDDLSFRRFDGTYSDLLGRVIDALSVLNDHFLTAYRQGRGISREVQSTLGRHHFDVSMESVKTRSSEKLMKLRDIVFGDTEYRCEWHVKIEPHRNRIHFWIGNDETDSPILVGLFVNHLPT